jgi:site-specific DNA-methyltransferase (cytosine-N4-specific)
MMGTYHEGKGVRLLVGDARAVMATMPNNSVDCVVTSPPYYGLRNYGQPGQYGLEPTPQDYVDTLQAVFAEVRRVLRPTGTVWLNLGDCYSAEPPGHSLPRKNLLGIPWRVATALQSSGWILRNAVVWAKRNPMPESVKDRLSTTYEFVFLLVKQPRYFFDLDSIRAPLIRPEALSEGLVIGGVNKGRQGGVDATMRRRGHSVYGVTYTNNDSFVKRQPGAVMRPPGRAHNTTHPRGKNPGDVWHLSTRPLREAHFATFPIDIPLRGIAAGCPAGGVVLDPFSGAGTTGLAALDLGRRYVGIDINPAYHDLALRRFTRHSKGGTA